LRGFTDPRASVHRGSAQIKEATAIDATTRREREASFLLASARRSYREAKSVTVTPVTEFKAKSRRDLSKKKTEKKRRRLISRKELLERVPLSYPRIWQLIREKKFPEAISLGDRKIAWYEDVIDAWIASRPVAKLKPLEGEDAR
jgi:predicted DNA-binding transcriptional regulator AlpA